MTHSSTPRLVLLAAMVGFAPTVVSAQQDLADNTAFGTKAAEFLLLGSNARGMALGGAYTAMATDVGGLNANPAAVALLTRPGAQFSQYNYIADTKLNWGAVAFPFGAGSKAFGVQLGTFGFSDQPVYTVLTPHGTGEVYGVTETFAALTYAQNFSDRFSVGFTGKAIFDQLGQASGTAFAMDFGTHFHSNLSGKPIRFAFTLSHLGTGMKYEGIVLQTTSPRQETPGDDDVPHEDQPSMLRTSSFALPTTFRVSLGYDVMSSANSRLSLLGEFNQANANKAGYGFGAELESNRLGGSGFGVALRGSWSAVPANKYETDFYGVGVDSESDEKMQGVALGAGINYQSPGFAVGFDYAWKKMGLLGDTSFFTVTLGW